MDIKYLKEILLKGKADFDIIYHDKPIVSRKDALELFKLEEMAPTLILKSEDKFLALIISGKSGNVDFQDLENKLNIKELRMAKPKEVKSETHLNPGQIPLVGHQLPCIIDKEIFKYSYVYGGSGDLNHTLKISPKSLTELNNVIFEL